MGAQYVRDLTPGEGGWTVPWCTMTHEGARYIDGVFPLSEYGPGGTFELRVYRDANGDWFVNTDHVTQEGLWQPGEFPAADSDLPFYVNPVPECYIQVNKEADERGNTTQQRIARPDCYDTRSGSATFP